MLCHDAVFLTEDMSREQKKKAKERANEEELTRQCVLFHANCSFVFSCFFFLVLFMYSSLNGQQHDDDEDEKDHHRVEATVFGLFEQLHHILVLPPVLISRARHATVKPVEHLTMFIQVVADLNRVVARVHHGGVQLIQQLVLRLHLLLLRKSTLSHDVRGCTCDLKCVR